MRAFLLSSVKIILLKSDNYALTLRKRLFCNAKPTLLPCKTAAFGMQNNRFCNTLVVRMLRSNYTYENFLHFYYLLSTYVTRGTDEIKWFYSSARFIRAANWNTAGTKIQSEKNRPKYIVFSLPWKKSMSFPSSISGIRWNIM